MVRRDLVPATVVKDRRMVESVRVARAAHAMIDREVNVRVALGKVEGRAIARRGRVRAPNDLPIAKSGPVAKVVHKKKSVALSGPAVRAKEVAQDAWNVLLRAKNGRNGREQVAVIAPHPNGLESAHRNSYAMVAHLAGHHAPVAMPARNGVPEADLNVLHHRAKSAASGSAMPARNAM